MLMRSTPDPYASYTDSVVEQKAANALFGHSLSHTKKQGVVRDKAALFLAPP